MTSNLAGAVKQEVGRRLNNNAEWDSPMFRLAQEQFLQAAQIMDLKKNVRERLLFPQRTLLRSQRDNLDMRTAARTEGINCVAQAKLLRGLFR